MRISHTTTTTVLGPGKRFVIWVQGCNKRCNGCINPEGWNLDGGTEVDIDSLMNDILKYKDIVGVTISGGEPFLQYGDLRILVERIKKETELDIMLYSGYTLSDIQSMYGNSVNSFFSNIDIFVDGEYKEEFNNETIYRGSDNQKIYYFTDKYASHQEEINNLHEREFSFELKDGSDVIFVGIPPKDFYEKFIEKIGEVKL